MPMRCSLRRTWAICSHISGDTENTETEGRLHQQVARAAASSQPALQCVCTHSPLLFSSCLFSAWQPTPPCRSGVMSGWTAPCLSSAAAEVAASSSAPPCGRGWRGGWAHARVAAPPSCSARVVCRTSLSAAATAGSHPTAGATAAPLACRPALHGEQRERRRNEWGSVSGTRGGCCASALEGSASWLHEGQA